MTATDFNNESNQGTQHAQNNTNPGASHEQPDQSPHQMIPAMSATNNTASVVSEGPPPCGNGQFSSMSYPTTPDVAHFPGATTTTTASVIPMDSNELSRTYKNPTNAAAERSSCTVATPPTARKKGWPRGRKRRCLPKDAPKAPLSGYMLYMAEQREVLRHSASPPSFTELAKMVAQQWGALPLLDKQKYLDMSDLEKERYQKEMAVYTKTHAYKQFMEQQKLQGQQPPTVPAGHTNAPSTPQYHNTSPAVTPLTSPQQETKRPRKEQHNASLDTLYSNSNRLPPANNVNLAINGVTNAPLKVNGCNATDDDDMVDYNSSPLEIPIFTDQFLKHNKAREAELRQLRKSNTDYEEQNALLQKHIESMKLSVDKYENETTDLHRKTAALQQHLATLRADLAKAFVSTPAPGWSSPPRSNNVDEYLVSLHASLTASPPASQTQSRAAQQAVQQLVTRLLLH